MDKMKLEKKEIKKIKWKIIKIKKMNRINKEKEFPKTGHESRTYYDRVVSVFLTIRLTDGQSHIF